VCGRIKPGPAFRSAGEAHVRSLHSFPRVTTFEEKAETDQSKCDGDRLRSWTGVLGRISVNRNLMDEESITVSQRVEREFVAQALAFSGGVYLRLWCFVTQSGQQQSAAGASDDLVPFFAWRADHCVLPVTNGQEATSSREVHERRLQWDTYTPANPQSSAQTVERILVSSGYWYQFFFP
jgi:hypothetical protein